jgi:hypothetical protein
MATVAPVPQHAASLTFWNGKSIGSGVSVGSAVGNAVAVGLGVGLAKVGTPMTTVDVGAGVLVGGASVGVAFGVGVSVGRVLDTWIPLT